MKGRLDGAALRVPVADGSITDFTAVLPGTVTVEQVNARLRGGASGPLSKVLVYTEDPDRLHRHRRQPRLVHVDAGLTMALPSASGITLVKVNGWYDNEWGYANRLVDLSPRRRRLSRSPQGSGHVPRGGCVSRRDQP